MKILSSDDKAITKVNALVYGESGIGKTTSLQTLPKGKTIVVFRDLQQSAAPLRETGFPVFEVEAWNDLRNLLVQLRNGKLEADGGESVNLNDIKVIAFDSIRGFAERCKHHIVTHDRPQLFRERTKNQSDKPFGTYDEQMTLEDWGLFNERMAGMISAMCRLPYHVIFTSLAEWEKDEMTGQVYRAPSMEGKKFAKDLPAYFNLVLYMESVLGTDGYQRLWRTTNDGKTIAKDSYGLLDVQEEPNWSTLFKKILSTKGNNK